MKSKLFKNVISGFGGQLLTIILGLIVPRFFIMSYGSDVNGLLSTITQIFTYLALLEAGIGNATQQLYFKALTKENHDEMNSIFVSSKDTPESS